MRLLRMLAALVLACTGLVLVAAGAQAACTCQGKGDAPSLERQVRAADVVFTGELASSTGGQGDAAATTYEVRGERLYQGDLPSDTVDVVSQGDCALRGMREGRSYVFLVTEEGAELRADRCGGTSRATDARVADVEQLLGSGTTLGPPDVAEPEPPVFTPVEGAEPEPLSRLAAPGLALVLVGALGLVVVRRASRRDRA